MKYLLFLFLIIAISSSCSLKQETTTPVAGNISESVYASGVVKSKNQYQLFPKVSGVVQRVLVTEGDVVKAGQTLMEIESEQAQLSAENARIAAEYSKVGANTEKLSEVQATINLSRKAMQNDSVLLVRQRNLWKQNIGTRVELEQRELAYQNSKTNFKSALLRYRDLKKQLEFSAKQSQTNLQISRSRAEDFKVKSETDGRVYSILREQGEMVTPQSPVAVMGDANGFLLELQVDEYDISRVKPGQKVLLHLDSYKDQVFEAVVAKINPAMNQRTRSFTVEATFVSAPPTLYPNLTTEANIV
ncbi:MAG: HlyD family efflux transporter periplasmic adaptor subunit, partial [Sphingobacteriales bacterium]